METKCKGYTFISGFDSGNLLKVEPVEKKKGNSLFTFFKENVILRQNFHFALES